MSDGDLTDRELRNEVRDLRRCLNNLRIDVAAIGQRLNSTQEQLHQLQRHHDALVLDIPRLLAQVDKDARIGVLAMAALWLISARLQPSDEWTQCPACQERYRTHELITHARQCHTLLDDVRSDGPPRPPLIV